MKLSDKKAVLTINAIKYHLLRSSENLLKTDAKGVLINVIGVLNKEIDILEYDGDAECRYCGIKLDAETVYSNGNYCNSHTLKIVDDVVEELL